jgi:CRISPR-associated helicase Cas3/CRISPR-associated endonuclease Cas3-HD
MVVNHGSTIWAKTDMAGDTDKWLSLRQHLLDTEGVSHYVWRDYLPSGVRARIDAALGGHGETVLAFLAGVHDIGKCTPAFEKQASYRDDLMDMLNAGGFTIPAGLGPSSNLRHETSGFMALMSWFQSHGVRLRDGERLAIIVGGHHGVYHSKTEYGRIDLGSYYGVGAWSDERTAIIDWMSDRTGFLTIVPDIQFSNIAYPIQSMLTACVVMSDWIASSAWLFPLRFDGNVPAGKERKRVDSAWRSIRLPTPWVYAERPNDVGDMLSEWFSLPHEVTPTEFQHDMVIEAESVHSPTMIILEAPMGSGKTEAALMAASIIGRNTGAGGVAFALPTQATANGMMGRFESWLPHVTNGVESFELLHGRSALNADYAELRKVCVSDESPVVVNRWFDGSKRGILASFVVCTIDQILMAALQAKHFDLRHLGLAGKVVIVDEVHAADDFMMVYLDRALEWLASLGCSVILMSATLPAARKNKMVSAYTSGLRGTVTSLTADDAAYPALTLVDTGGMRHVHPQYTSTSQSIAVEHCGSDDVPSVVSDAVSDGGCACVVCNTIGSAQSLYSKMLARGFGHDEIMLVHSRFNGRDRAARDGALLRMFGPDVSERPKRFIVIGTQVLEQSLDIDFDFMVSEIAPIDLILQRAGRLHRHSWTERPDSLRTPRLVVTGYEINGDEISIDEGSLFVYGFGISKNKSKILRSISLIESSRHSFTIPDDINGLIQRGYDYESKWDGLFSDEIDIEDGKLDRIIRTKERDAQTTVLADPFPAIRPGEMVRVSSVLYGCNDKGSVSDQKLMARVRDSDSSLSVIVLLKAQGGLLLSSEDIRSQYGIIGMNESISHDMAVVIMSQTINLPPLLSHPGIIDGTIRELEKDKIDAWQTSPLLAGELVLLLDENGERTMEIGNAVFHVRYDTDMGLVVDKIRKNK